MSNNKELKKEIYDKIREYYHIVHKKRDFLPGRDYIPYAGRVYDEKELLSLTDAVLDFWLTSGKFTKKLEAMFSEFLGVKYTVLCNSGSSANLLAISALTSHKLGKKRLKPGDEIITVAAAFPTTVNPIVQNRCVPVFVDIEPATYNIDTDALVNAISDKTRAIFIAHTLGNPFNIDDILEIKEEYGLWLIEDCCDALGSKYLGKYVSNFGELATFSFYPAHHITTGEGGAVVTNDPLLKKIILSFRDWGRDCWCEPGHDNTCGMRFNQKFGKLPLGYDHKYVYSHIGYNLKALDLQAAIGVEQLKKLPSFISARKENFHFYLRKLREYEDIFILPKSYPNADPCWFGFPITLKDNAGFTRNEITKYLEDHKVATRLLFAGNITKQPAYSNIKYKIHNSLANTDNVMNNMFWIGIYPGITAEMRRYVIETIEQFIRERL